MKRLLQFGKKYRQRTKSIFSKMVNFQKIGQFGKKYQIISVRDTEASVRDTDKELNINNKTIINKIDNIITLILDILLHKKSLFAFFKKTYLARRIEWSIPY